MKDDQKDQNSINQSQEQSSSVRELSLVSRPSSYQSRFVAYAHAHGNDPDLQGAIDEEMYPGGCMTGFILWVGDKWCEWKKATKWSGINLSLADHIAFDHWLTKEEGRNP